MCSFLLASTSGNFDSISLHLSHYISWLHACDSIRSVITAILLLLHINWKLIKTSYFIGQLFILFIFNHS